MEVASLADEGVRLAVAAADEDGDGVLSVKERHSLRSLTVPQAKEVSGLGTLFPELTELTLTGGTATAVDVSDAPALASLHVESEPIETLDLSANTALTDLKVADDTTVTGLDATGLQEVWLITELKRTGGPIAPATMTAEYDDADRPVKVSEAFEGVAGEPAMAARYTWDEQGRLASFTPLGNGDSSLEDRPQLILRDDSRRVAGIAYEPDDMPMPSFTYEGSSPYPNAVYPSARGFDVCHFKYDDAGRLQETFGKPENCGTVRSWDYDSSGNVTARHETDMTGSTLTTTYTYDDQGRRTKVDANVLTEGGPQHIVHDLSYDDAGRLVSDGESTIERDTTGRPVSITKTDGTTIAVSTMRRFKPKDWQVVQGLALPVTDGYPMTDSQQVLQAPLPEVVPFPDEDTHWPYAW